MKTYEDVWGPYQSHDQAVRLSDQSQKVLEQLQPKRNHQTAAWLTDLFRDHPISNDKHFDSWIALRNAKIEEAGRALVDRMFVEFEGLAKQFNESAFGTKFTVILSKPTKTFQLVDRRDPSSCPYQFTCYEGHVVTFSWALLVRTYFESIQIFVVPHDAVFGLQVNSIDTIKPFIELRAAAKEDTVTWAFAGKLVAPDMVAPVCRELFGDLVRIASGTMSESELFQNPSQPLILGTNVAIGHGTQDGVPAGIRQIDGDTSEQHDDSGMSHRNAGLRDVIGQLQLLQLRSIVMNAVSQDLIMLGRCSSDPVNEAHLPQLQRILQGYKDFHDVGLQLFDALGRTRQS